MGQSKGRNHPTECCF